MTNSLKLKPVTVRMRSRRAPVQPIRISGSAWRTSQRPGSCVRTVTGIAAAAMPITPQPSISMTMVAPALSSVLMT